MPDNAIFERCDLRKEFAQLPLAEILVDHLKPGPLKLWRHCDIIFYDRDGARKPLTFAQHFEGVHVSDTPSIGETWLCQVPPDEPSDSTVWRWIPVGGRFEVFLKMVDTATGKVSGNIGSGSEAMFPTAWLVRKIS